MNGRARPGEASAEGMLEEMSSSSSTSPSSCGIEVGAVVVEVRKGEKAKPGWKVVVRVVGMVGKWGLCDLVGVWWYEGDGVLSEQAKVADRKVWCGSSKLVRASKRKVVMVGERESRDGGDEAGICTFCFLDKWSHKPGSLENRVLLFLNRRMRSNG